MKKRMSVVEESEFGVIYPIPHIRHRYARTAASLRDENLSHSCFIPLTTVPRVANSSFLSTHLLVGSPKSVAAIYSTIWKDYGIVIDMALAVMSVWYVQS